MIGSEKASTIRRKLRAAFAREQSKPIPALDRRTRELEKREASARPELRPLRLLRRALAQVVDPNRRNTARPARAK
jgi:hypothetical protein